MLAVSQKTVNRRKTRRQSVEATPDNSLWADFLLTGEMVITNGQLFR